MTLHQLKVWVAVAKRQNMTKAAAELRIRQPSVTQQVKPLEREYGLKLYEVNNRGIKLTPAGKLLLKYAKRTLSQVDNLERDVRRSVRRRHQRG